MSKTFALMVFGLILSGCFEENSGDLYSNDDLVIKSGFVCGWGSGTDTIEISGTTVRYVYYIPRLSNQPQFRQSRTLTASEQTEIRKEVKMEVFTRLTLNTCNVCFDGCDEWIYILENELEHKITYGMGDRIESISGLQQILAQLRKEFKPQ